MPEPQDTPADFRTRRNAEVLSRGMGGPGHLRRPCHRRCGTSERHRPYPAIAGLPPEAGLYASILAVVGYALFGPSQRLIMGP